MAGLSGAIGHYIPGANTILSGTASVGVLASVRGAHLFRAGRRGSY